MLSDQSVSVASPEVEGQMSVIQNDFYYDLKVPLIIATIETFGKEESDDPSAVSYTHLKHVMTGVSYMIPAVTVGGVCIAIALATGTAGANGMEVTNEFWANINTCLLYTSS